MNKAYAFLFMAILLGIAFFSSLLAYHLVRGELFLAGIFVLSALLVASIFLLAILLWQQPRQKREKRMRRDIPLMPFPTALEKPAKEWKVSTYNVEQPEVEPVFDSLWPSPEISDNDFVELDELDKLAQAQMTPSAKKTRNRNGRKRKK